MTTTAYDTRRADEKARAERFRTQIAAIIPAAWVIKDDSRAVIIEAELPGLTLRLHVDPADQWFLTSAPEVVVFTETAGSAQEIAAEFLTGLRAWWAGIDAALPPTPEA